MKTIEQILKEIKNRNVSKDSVQQMGEMIQAILDDSRKSLGLDLDSFSATALGGIIDSKIKLLEEERPNLEKFVNVDKEIESLTDEAIQSIRDRIIKKAEAGEINDEEAQTLKKLFKKYVQLQKTQEKFNEGLAKGEAAAKQLLQATLGLSTEWAFLSDTRGFSGLWKGIKKGMMESLSFTNIMASVITKVVERAFMFDELQADMFRKAGIRREDLNIEEMSADLRGMSKDYAEVKQKGVIDLKMQFRDFSSFSEQEVSTLASTIAVLEKRGASSQNAISALTTLNKAIGFTATESNQLLLNQMAIAEVSQRPIQEQIAEFDMGLAGLARFGKDSVGIFNKIKRDANKAAVEFRTLRGMEEEADTFEGAAQMAQAFNLAIAGPMGAAILNPLELVGLEIGEKVNLLQKRYKDAGSPTLSPRLVRSLASSFKIPEDELLRIFNVENIDSKGKDVASAQTSLDEQKELIKKEASMQEKVNAAMVNFTDTVLEMIGGSSGLISIIDSITYGINLLADNIYTVTAILGSLYGIQLINSARGATPFNPEFVVSQPQVGGKVGKLLTGAAIIGTTAIGGGMLADSMTNPDESISKLPSGGAGLAGSKSFLGAPSPNARPNFKSPATQVVAGNDTPASMSSGGAIRIGAGRSMPKMLTSNYVVPRIDVVHKDDRLYFAKNDGALMQKINEAKSIAQSNSEKKQPTTIRISKREFREMIKEALGDVI